MARSSSATSRRCCRPISRRISSTTSKAGPGRERCLRGEESVMRVPLSILDLAPIARGESASDSFAGSVALAQRAEELGYLRVWYAEHHNMASIASSATSVLIAHVGAQTQTIRLGSGGVMLP